MTIFDGIMGCRRNGLSDQWGVGRMGVGKMGCRNYDLTPIYVLYSYRRYQREVIGIRRSKENRQHNSKKDKRTNNDLQNTICTQKLKIEEMNPTENRGCSGMISSSCSTSGAHRVTLVTIHVVISHKWGNDVQFIQVSVFVKNIGIALLQTIIHYKYFICQFIASLYSE